MKREKPHVDTAAVTSVAALSILCCSINIRVNIKSI